jgi:hypothetical protein
MVVPSTGVANMVAATSGVQGVAVANTIQVQGMYQVQYQGWAVVDGMYRGGYGVYSTEEQAVQVCQVYAEAEEPEYLNVVQSEGAVACGSRLEADCVALGLVESGMQGVEVRCAE